MELMHLAYRFVLSLNLAENFELSIHTKYKKWHTGGWVTSREPTATTSGSGSRWLGIVSDGVSAAQLGWCTAGGLGWRVTCGVSKWALAGTDAAMLWSDCVSSIHNARYLKWRTTVYVFQFRWWDTCWWGGGGLMECCGLSDNILDSRGHIHIKVRRNVRQGRELLSFPTHPFHARFHLAVWVGLALLQLNRRAVTCSEWLSDMGCCSEKDNLRVIFPFSRWSLFQIGYWRVANEVHFHCPSAHWNSR